MQSSVEAHHMYIEPGDFNPGSRGDVLYGIAIVVKLLQANLALFSDSDDPMGSLYPVL